MRKTHRIVAALACALPFIAVLAAPAWTQAEPTAPGLQDPASTAPSSPEARKAPIDLEGCIADNREFWVPTAECLERYGVGRRLFASGTKYSEQIPFNQDEDEVCSSDPQHQHYQKRVLSGDTIKKFITEKRTVGAAGIRILGAIFCEELDLAGLDLPYSLVIDRAVFKKGIDARNLRVGGDLSFDNSIIFGSFNLRRARIDGSFWGRWSFIENVDLSDIEMKGTASFLESVILRQASFIGVSISRGLDLERTSMSKLTVQSGQITGEINLSQSIARCAYVVRATTIGRVTADRVGFGEIVTQADGARASYLWWARAADGAPKEIFESVGTAKTLEKFRADVARPARERDPRWVSGCEDKNPIEQLRFVVIDTIIPGRLCLTRFAWVAPAFPVPAALPETVIALNSTRISGSVAIDLDGVAARGQATAAFDASRKTLIEKRRFEAVGLTTGALVLNFDDSPRMPYRTWIDGLSFDRIAKASQACESAPQDVKDTLPSTAEVIAWLDKNTAPSSQPFKAFTDAFERAGADASDLRVARKTIDLCRKTPSWFPVPCPQPTKDADHVTAGMTAAVGNWDMATEFLSLVFKWKLYYLADHGVRPEKVVWWLAGFLLAFWLLFWFALRIVGFKPKEKDKAKGHAKSPRPWPLGFLFLFDRSLPLYKIREEHYAIDTYFRRATRAEIVNKRNSTDPPHPMSYFGVKSWVYPLPEDQKHRAEKWLVALRIIGAVLAIFLLAAINALTARG